jgi:hypothetical protein
MSSSLSTLTIKDNIVKALIRPGGYKLKAKTFADATLKLEGEAAASSALYQRSEAARGEIINMLALLDPIVGSFLAAFTGGKTKYEVGKLTSTKGQDQQDAILMTLSAIGICLHLGLMEKEVSDVMDTHLQSASTSMTVLEEDIRTHYTERPVEGLLDVFQNGVLTADLLGLGDGEADPFTLPSRPTVERSKKAKELADLLDGDDPYTPILVRKKKDKGKKKEVSLSQEVVLHASSASTSAELASYFPSA